MTIGPSTADIFVSFLFTHMRKGMGDGSGRRVILWMENVCLATEMLYSWKSLASLRNTSTTGKEYCRYFGGGEKGLPNLLLRTSLFENHVTLKNSCYSTVSSLDYCRGIVALYCSHQTYVRFLLVVVDDHCKSYKVL